MKVCKMWDDESSYLPHYEKIYDIIHTIGNQNYCLFDFIISRGLVEEWNEFYRQQKEQNQWIAESNAKKNRRKNGVK